jgi:hypothetical protein
VHKSEGTHFATTRSEIVIRTSIHAQSAWECQHFPSQTHSPLTQNCCWCTQCHWPVSNCWAIELWLPTSLSSSSNLGTCMHSEDTIKIKVWETKLKW